jgi:glycosyltransferase involved in cell wall biosynthesis
MNPTISVIVTCYNYGRYVTDALADVQAQTMGDFECVVIDDGSKDDSVERITKFLADPRFRLVRLDHAGQTRAKNAGLRQARGRFLAFLDADDRWRGDKLARQLAMFEGRPELGVVYSRRRMIDEAGKVTAGDTRTFYRGDVLDYLFRDNFVCFSSTLVRREAADHVGLFDERLPLAIDYDWWLRMARFTTFDYVDEPLVDYRMGHDNLSRRVVERLDTVIGIMARFQTEHDIPARLDPRVARLALAETYRHRGIVDRRGPGAGRRWLLKALAMRPYDLVAWKALAVSFAPEAIRRGWRHLRNEPDWELRIAG